MTLPTLISLKFRHFEENAVKAVKIPTFLYQIAHGNERIADLKQQSEHDFTVGKGKIIRAEREIFTDEFKKGHK